MKNKTKDFIITIGFVVILIVIFIINISIKDKEISLSERRKLTQFPKITFEKIINGEFSNKFENYAIDQFIFRDSFRGIKSFFSIKILKQQDNNKLFEKDGAIYKIEYPLNEKKLEKSIEKINKIQKEYLQEMNVYYAIIPDKNYYLENDNHLKLNYNKLKQIISQKIKNMKYIDIWNDLNLSDFYKTDLHWKQENLVKIANKIQTEMELIQNENIKYEKRDFGDFYGTYYGQLGLNLSPDKMYILLNDLLENCKTYNYETKEIGKIYDIEKINSKDKYDIFLSGPTPIIDILNPNSTTDKELLLFRDSFGSSIAPLLIQNYKKITLIDLRYIASDILDRYINFNNQDVLFLYSILILNQNILK